ncbi:hypothetical protein BECAL_00495 [Bellilinea caldifistulae]|uniref:Uncharacterized protein n=1 Tax=Bellilinea caldifistulae TaxID=360411 RepID=A0A0P6X2H7_9CHLR|nr:hypothetical protein [Bellilinea caldifistulae]KPL75214.1 hypothetical protein AC812_09645 [Bellilinea caldifistulae]GAP09352.1 hypothetical protein BECAL_00495 [Bellilinea caldifistulae]
MIPNRLRLILRNLLILVVFALVQVRSEYNTADPVERVRRFTRWMEFDYVSWTLDALRLKQQQAALNLPRFLSIEQQRQVVLRYLERVERLNQVRSEINALYADPNILNPEQAAAGLLAEQESLTIEINQRLAPLAESVMQYQLSLVVADLGLGLGGQPIPPPLYHVTSLPYALIVSPREVIRQDADISLVADLSLDQIVQLERQVEQGLNVSALVVPVGGVGTYPTMVMSTTDLNWLAEVIAHEWIHNTLTLRPLGALYYASPEMRTINETTASIAGKEIGAALIERFYPEKVPPPAPPSPPLRPSQPQEPPAFDFRAEMRETRVTVDALLAEGKIEEAENYMEQRRRVFWENGYRIRRLNQAYFAFYGAYADQPGGAAGEDPVPAAVRALRAQSPSLAVFINRIAWVTSYEALTAMLEP